MATYKVPQDVEAEDKLIGNLSFRQFIYACVAAGFIFIGYLFYRVKPILVVTVLPFILTFGILGFYRREDQPAESYIVAFINYLIKPRKRLWNPSGIVETVIITAPKKQVIQQAKPLEQVEGQLQRIAKVMDTRGWSIKRPELQEPIPALQFNIEDDDRLVTPDIKQNNEPLDVHVADDVLDVYNNPVALNFESMIKETEKKSKDKILAKMHSGQTTNQAAEEPLPSNIHFDPFPEMHQRVLNPHSTPTLATGNLGDTQQGMTPISTTGILDLSDELTVSQIAAHANRKLTAGEEINLRHASSATTNQPKHRPKSKRASN